MIQFTKALRSLRRFMDFNADRLIWVVAVVLALAVGGLIGDRLADAKQPPMPLMP